MNAQNISSSRSPSRSPSPPHGRRRIKKDFRDEEGERWDSDVVDSSPTSESLKAKTPQPTPIAIPVNILLFIASLYPVSLCLASFSTVLFIPSKNYFSLKTNIFNVFFVKFGWLWTTLVFVLHVKRLQRTALFQPFLRWAIATMWWLFITQWFFGPPIMDRTFTLTGGICDIANDPDLVSTDFGVPKLLVTSAACKIAKGAWIGGHDLSGHVFMLTHSSLFLWSELLPLVMMGPPKQRNHGATWAVLALLGLWWWMLIMTGVHFHTWREKFSGLVVSTLEWIVVYMYGIRHSSVVREILGVPGS